MPAQVQSNWLANVQALATSPSVAVHMKHSQLSCLQVMQPCPVPYNCLLTAQVMKRIKASVSSKQHGFEDLLCPLIAQVCCCLVLTKADAALYTCTGLQSVGVWQQVDPAAFGMRVLNLATPSSRHPANLSLCNTLP